MTKQFVVSEHYFNFVGML